MIDKKSAKKQLKAFRKMAEKRYLELDKSQKLAAAAIAALLVGLSSVICKSMIDSPCAKSPELAEKTPKD